jgi:Oxyanion-translocating ATPase
MVDDWKSTSLFKRKLWIVTGKGGVGKTTLTAALGLFAASQGFRTLVVETHGLTHLGEILEKGRVGYEPARVRENLYLVQLTAEQAFEEYVLQQVKLKVIYNTVFNNRYVRHFIDAAPGLHELLTIGKIWSLVSSPPGFGPKKNFDLVIVDAPATGHGLSLLTVARVVADAVRIGPLKSKAEEILQLLQNSSLTMTWLATLPEEMPVNEALEMAEKLESEAKVQLGPVLMNSVWPKLVSDEALKELSKKAPNLVALQVYKKRQSQNQYYLDKLQTSLPASVCYELPLVYQTHRPLEIAQALCGRLRELFSGKKGRA